MIRRYVDDEYSIKDVAKEFGTNFGTLQRKFHKWGVSLRPKYFDGTERSRLRSREQAISWKGSHRIGRFHSEESKRKGSETRKLRFSLGLIRVVNGMKGRKHKPETIAMYSDMRKGEKNGMFGRSHSDYARKLQREARLRQKIPTEETSIERVVISQLIRSGFAEDEEFFTQYRVDDFLYDFFIPGFNLLIECDGEYWHADKLKDECAERNGFKLLRVGERDIRKDSFDILSIIRGDICG